MSDETQVKVNAGGFDVALAEAKPQWASKTNILGVLLLIVAVLQFLPATDVIPESWLKYVLAIAGVLTIVIRQYTMQPVGVDQFVVLSNNKVDNGV